MNLYQIADRVSVIEPGQWITFDRHTLEAAAPAMPLTHPLGPVWSPAERIMENIIGSAYKFRFRENHEKGTVTFERLKQPLSGKENLRTYVSPDRADLFEYTPEGFYRPKSK
jgi:hypothetical protein